MNHVGILLAMGCVLAPGAALAESPACSPMQGQYVALLRQSASSSPAVAAAQLAAAEADGEHGNCHRFLFFGPPKSPACPAIQATIDRLQRQLDGDGLGSSVDEQKAVLRETLQQSNCSIPSVSASGPGRTLCVRTCDGYYFPLSNHISSKQIKTDATACQAMYGETGLATLFVQRADDVAEARSMDGKRYGDQPFAFVYRNTYRATCQAELKDGVAALETKVAKFQPTVTATSIPIDATVVVTRVVDATSSAAPDAMGAVQALGQASAAHRVRFVGSAYYSTMFGYGGE